MLQNRSTMVPRKGVFILFFQSFLDVNSSHFQMEIDSEIGKSTPNPTNPTREQILRHLHRANQVAKRAYQFGHHPFGSILIGPDHETELIAQGNIDAVNHAESTLARIACTNFSSDYLWTCTLYSTFEPCVMCAGTIYWSNIGRVVYGVEEKRLLQLTGDSKDNPTMNIPCRYVFEHGQKNIQVLGPVPELETALMEPHKGFWKKTV